VRVELLDGLLVDMTPQGEVHARVIQRLMWLFNARRYVLRVQMPLLVVEVSVSSQAIDRRKALAYARAGVPRHWLVDLPAGVVLAHMEPSDDGYALVTRLEGDDVLDAGVDGVETTTVAALLTT
jgi:Uma2 family endonuclease